MILGHRLQKRDASKSAPAAGIEKSLHQSSRYSPRIGNDGRDTGTQLVILPLLKIRAEASCKKRDSTPLMGDAPKNWCPNPSYMFSLRVHGNSMAPLIQNGYIVAVDSSETDLSRLDGRIVIAWHKDVGLTISRFCRYGHTDVLVSENTEYEAVAIHADHPWRIVGVVVWWVGRAP
jgi:SOS-response transcriptional repressor LexA